MHSRIFQVSMEPINKADYIVESDYWDHWFTNTWADYVSEDCDRKDSIEWLKNCYETKGIKFGTDDNGEYFIVKNKQAYFENSFKAFTDILEEIAKYTIEDFTYGFIEMYSLKQAYENKYGFYVDADGELMTLDSFIRGCATGEIYYIGNTIDYHF